MFDLKQYLVQKTKLVECELDKCLKEADRKPQILHEAMRYSIFTGGKRLRPILCLAACEMAGGTIDNAMPAALAVEIYHTYTLVHDDLPCMDDDDFRRGKPTVHKKYDEVTAVLAGDALQAMSFEVLSSAKPLPPYDMSNMLLELSDAAGSVGVVGGQVEDLACNGKQISGEELDFIHRSKTARLFIAALRLGAMAAGADNQQFENMGLYGEHLGLAFQLADDILDGIQDSAGAETVTGDGNLSCLTIMTLDEAQEKMKEHLKKAEEVLSIFDESLAEPLLEIGRYIEYRVASGKDVPDNSSNS